ncbi:hypothetical protein K438DRAFT_1766427 [Mycena galopus ATCC 62051]|nr:hypothetical protein K438DRAFT_1766427 [Mycena galopus ATCC 62051]
MCNSLGKAAQQTSGWIMSYSAIAPLRQQIYFDIPVLDLEPFGLLTCVVHAAFFFTPLLQGTSNAIQATINCSRPKYGASAFHQQGCFGGQQRLRNPYEHLYLLISADKFPPECRIGSGRLAHTGTQTINYALRPEQTPRRRTKPTKNLPVRGFRKDLIRLTFSIVADFARSRVRVSLEWRAGLQSRGELEDEIFYFRSVLMFFANVDTRIALRGGFRSAAVTGKQVRALSQICFLALNSRCSG